MKEPLKKKCECQICKRNFSLNQVTPLSLVRDSILKLIKEEHPSIESDDVICFDDLNMYRKKIFEQFIADEEGDLNQIKSTVLNALQERETISSNLNEDDSKSLTLGQRCADRIASFGGSWSFILLALMALTTWIAWNIFSNKVFDPYPFILLNLFLSCIAALQAPIIMMSQNRQSERDRKRLEEDYMVNLKTEIDIRMLNEKIDKLVSHQWQRLLKIQEMQVEMMEEMQREKN